MEVEWSPLSIQRVLELADYIALDKPDVATQWASDIFDSTEKVWGQYHHYLAYSKLYTINEKEQTCRESNFGQIWSSPVLPKIDILGI